MNEQQLSTFERELVVEGLSGRLTEQRYNEILDVLLPNTSVPDARATLKGFGEPAWRERREARERAVQAA